MRFDKFDKNMEDTYMSYLKDLTTHIDVKGCFPQSYESSVSHRFIIQLETKCPELTHLGLSSQVFDASEVSKVFLFVYCKYRSISHFKFLTLTLLS